MKAAPPENQSKRLAALYEHQILDTPREAEFDAIVQLVAAICRTPIAVVNFIDEHRQWFKSEVGLGVRETPLDTSLCAHALLEQDILVVPDTQLDRRFANNPLVTGSPKLRFYAGVLLKTSSQLPLGTLCVLDVQPRHLDEAQIDALKTLGSHVMNLLNLRAATRAAEAATNAHRQLLAMVSHDLRTPLNVVSLCAHRLTLTPDVAGHEIAVRLKRAARTALHLVDDLVDAASLEANSLTLQIQEASVSDLLAETVDFFAPLADQAHVALYLMPSTELPSVAMDYARVRQALANVVGNALKFTPPQGAITIGADAAAGSMAIWVRDTGPGIPPDQLAHVFEPHWRTPGSVRGAGLGLSIVRSLVEAHGGDVCIDSVVGEGTTLTLRLPLAIGNASPA